VKIATFNVNNINKRLSNLLAWLESSQPDVICLQELKATDAAFPVEILNSAGYSAICEVSVPGTASPSSPAA